MSRTAPVHYLPPGRYAHTCPAAREFSPWTSQLADVTCRTCRRDAGEGAAAQRRADATAAPAVDPRQLDLFAAAPPPTKRARKRST